MIFTKAHEIRMTEPEKDFSPFEKRYGDMRDVWAANEKVFKKLIDEKKLSKIAKTKATSKIAYRG